MSDVMEDVLKITTSYTVAIKKQIVPVMGTDGTVSDVRQCCVNDALMKSTSDICLAALKLCTEIFLKEWDRLSALPTGQKKGVLSRKRGADIMIHGTKKNKAQYPEFDKQFPCMPSYTRRAIIAYALGKVSSYVSNHNNWKALSPSERGEEPTLGLPERYELTFYDKDRNLEGLAEGVIGLRLYNGKTWGWYFFRIRPSEAQYIAKMRKTRKMLSPVVEKVRGRYYIRFSFEESRDLVEDTDPLSYRILAVDLGINAAASWCVMTSDGTVHAKGVIHLACEEGRLRHLMNRKKMYQQAGKRSKSIYRMVTDANRRLSIETSRQVMDRAVLYDVDCIVFEHLDRKGRVRGKGCRERIHMWRANDVQARVELQAHRCGMRISRVCAWGTSKLAFDGSGPVKRDRDNYSLCTFTTGKRYNCDLSACQNIGARYYLRLLAKQPGCPVLPSTPQRTYATLRPVVRSQASA